MNAIVETRRERVLRQKKEHYYRHRESILVKQKAYAQKNREKISVRWSAWYQKTRDRKRAYDKKRMQTPGAIESHRKACREYARRNPIKNKAWSLSHPEELKELKNRWAKEHPENAKLGCKRRRARILGCKSDSTAETFYKFVRSKKRIPCYYCGTIISGKKAHIDHIVALSKSGNHASDNLCASCPSCNLKKNDKTISEINATRDQPLLEL